MTRDDIIRMAHTANFEGFGNGDWVCTTEEIERFAALVAAAEREKLKQSIRHSLTIGPKTIQTRIYFGEEEVSTVKMPIEDALVELAVKKEREECADVCDQHATCEGVAQLCAAAIRSRT